MAAGGHVNSSQGVVSRQDVCGLTIHCGRPTGEVLVSEDEEAGLGACCGYLDALRLVTLDLNLVRSWGRVCGQRFFHSERRREQHRACRVECGIRESAESAL